MLRIEDTAINMLGVQTWTNCQLHCMCATREGKPRVKRMSQLARVYEEGRNNAYGPQTNINSARGRARKMRVLQSEVIQS